MEIVLFVLMLVVPVFSVVSLVMVLNNNRKVKALKTVVLANCRKKDATVEEQLEMLEI